MSDEELKKARETDDTAFRCVTCGLIKNGFGARICYGWACSTPCLEAHSGCVSECYTRVEK